MERITVACIQTNSKDDLAANVKAATEGVREAAAAGAGFITLPENVFFMQAPGKGAHPDATAAIGQMRTLAAELKVWVLIGSVQMPAPKGKAFNRSLLLDDRGNVAAQYDKIHLFDVQLANGETYAESDRITPGAEAVLVHAPFGKVGVTVCYDVRFPHLHRALAHAGASIITVPAAFTYTTGSAHWHVLLRARAIETGCFVVAPAQCGMHPGSRRTYGHSLIVAPWGEILAEGSEAEPGIVLATLDLTKVQQARGMVPNLQHDRVFKLREY